MGPAACAICYSGASRRRVQHRLQTVTSVVVSASTAARQTLSHDFLVTNARLFDGATTKQKTQVAVVDGVIRAVGDDLSAWQHLPTIDATGATLLPGLIDAHVHIRDGDDLRQALRFGVTTEIDMGTIGVTEEVAFALRSAANGSMDMAGVRSAGFPATAPGAHGTESKAVFPAVGTVAEARAFVAARRAAGSDHLKIMLNGLRSATTGMQNLDAPGVKTLIATAHDAGMIAVAHVETIADVEVALASRYVRKTRR